MGRSAGGVRRRDARVSADEFRRDGADGVGVRVERAGLGPPTDPFAAEPAASGPNRRSLPRRRRRQPPITEQSSQITDDVATQITDASSSQITDDVNPQITDAIRRSPI